MAKSSLDLTGAKAQKLELDVLRLIYAVQYLRRQGHEAHGYLVVLRPELAVRSQTWLTKYQAVDCVTCLCHAGSDAEIKTLLAEKESNVAGMISGSRGEATEGRSEATLGQSIGELALSRLIAVSEPGVESAPLTIPRPFGVQWDFYGML